MLIELQQSQDLDAFIERSRKEPVLLFKHSTQCGISADALDQLNEFIQTNSNVPCGLILVLEHRDLSDTVEDRFEIRHESPQAIVLVNGNPTWNASHRRITQDALRQALGK